MRIAFAGMCVALAAFVLVNSGNFQASEGGGDDKAKYTIKQVMKGAHAGRANSLIAKVIGGTADKDQKAKLVEYYEALSKNTPPEGSKEAWKKRTKRMLALAKKVHGGDAKAAKQLKRAANCGSCHKLFKKK